VTSIEKLFNKFFDGGVALLVERLVLVALRVSCERLRNFASIPDAVARGGATRPIPRDGGVEKLHGDPTYEPRPKVQTKGQKWKKSCTNVSSPGPGPLTKGGSKWRDNYPEGSDHSVAPNRMR